jgi:hypothetical protein
MFVYKRDWEIMGIFDISANCTVGVCMVAAPLVRHCF